MKIFVDADACPVVHIVEKLAKKYEMAGVCYSMLPVINIRENFDMGSRKVRVC